MLWPLAASWSTNKNGNRGAQKLPLYGSNGNFTASSFRLREGQLLGNYLMIFWQIKTVTSQEENTTFQEVCVE